MPPTPPRSAATSCAPGSMVGGALHWSLLVLVVGAGWHQRDLEARGWIAVEHAAVWQAQCALLGCPQLSVLGWCCPPAAGKWQYLFIESICNDMEVGAAAPSHMRITCRLWDPGQAPVSA